MTTIRPLITEKSMALAQKGWYSFAVFRNNRKEDIAKEIAKLYKVTVTDIRTIRRVGKTRRVGRKMMIIRKPDWKKAMVKLVKGQKIAVFDVGGESQPAK